MAKKNKKGKKKPKVHEELEGFDIRINEFGELESKMGIDKLNKFLNKKVEDKKLKDRDSEEEE